MNGNLEVKMVLDGLAQGKVSREEADAYLRDRCGTTLEGAIRAATGTDATIYIAPDDGQPSARQEDADGRSSRRSVIIVITMLLIAIMAGFSMWNLSSPSGLVTLDIPHANITGATYPINMEVVGIAANGTLYGEGSAEVWLDTTMGPIIVVNITSDDGTPRTDKPSYAVGDDVRIDHAPTDATYYLDDGSASAAITIPFAAPATDATLLVVANMSGTLTTYRLPIIIGDMRRTTTFSGCGDACTMNATNGTLRVVAIGDASVALDTVELTPATPNRPPAITTPFETAVVNGTTTINLSSHFADPDGDALLYSAGTSTLVDAHVDGDILTLTATNDGGGELLVYASDLKELTQATLPFTAIAPPWGTQGNGTDDTGANATGNASAPPSGNDTAVNATDTPANLSENATTDTTLNTTSDIVDTALNATNGTIDCSDPDPNLRPLDCLNLNATRFLSESIYWENVDRTRVARFTPVGNLLISGRVHQDAVGGPQYGDFAITYRDADLNAVPTIWIDTATGDLYLRGNLHEEMGNIVPPAGSYSVMNLRGVYLAHADARTGDLYIRGNIIPLRTDIND